MKNMDLNLNNPLSEEFLNSLRITMDDFLQAIPKVQPSAKREGFSTIPNVTWEDIGALENIREELKKIILNPVEYREKYEKIGIGVTSSGLLLYGPPGCGKTIVAKAIANECQVNFLSVKGPELLNKYVGESERGVRRVFSMAKSSAPCIIFFDELDSLCPTRIGGENQVTERVVNQMLTEMDGLDQRKEIFIIAATNRPDMIDSAILRPGRLDQLLYVPLPTPESRVKILKTCSRKIPLDKDVNLEEIALSNNCNGFSGADLNLLVREAGQCCVEEAIRENIDDDKMVVKKKHFEEALKRVNRSVSLKQEQHYDNIKKKIENMRRGPLNE